MVQIFDGSQWHIAIGSIHELITYMGTGSINDIDIKGMIRTETGSPAIVYLR